MSVLLQLAEEIGDESCPPTVSELRLGSMWQIVPKAYRVSPGGDQAAFPAWVKALTTCSDMQQ